jgi:hypothetical protein
MIISPSTNRLAPIRSSMRQRRTLILVFALVIALVSLGLTWPWLFNLAGDAQVHLAVAEQFSQGHPFQFNSNNEIVTASTSPFWTMLLTLGFTLVGAAVPLLLKIVCVIAWLSTSYLLYRAARELWHLPMIALLAMLGWWLTSTTIISNALSGMENILSAAQLLLIYYLSVKWRDRLSARRIVVLGIIEGWAILTRPDGGLFAASVLGLLLVCEAIAQRPVKPLTRLKQFGWLLMTVLVIIAPWYIYQYQLTGNLVTDSSIARLYAGRQGSLPILGGLLYFYPKALVSLGAGFLPILAGAIILMSVYGLGLLQTKSDRGRFVLEHYPYISAAAIVVIGLVFYSFVVGAEAFGRYFLPIFPFLFLCGTAGLQRLEERVQPWLKIRFPVLIIITTLFMLTTSGVDFYRRVIVGQFDSEPILNVIYGPANIQYFSYNLQDIIAAPALRAQHTAELRQALGLTTQAPFRMAVTEVQLRYFLDDSVTILSLDGRTSAAILNDYNPSTGVPDFARYFDAARPDFVHVAQWCAVGGWLSNLSSSVIKPNLVCDWQTKISRMHIGDTFDWNGHTIVYVAPDIVRIEWSNAQN